MPSSWLSPPGGIARAQHFAPWIPLSMLTSVRRGSLDRREVRHRALDSFAGVFEVLELPREVLVVGPKIEVSVAREVEEDDARLPLGVGLLRLLHRGLDGVRARSEE